MKLPTPFIALAGALLTTACTGIPHTSRGGTSRETPIHAFPVAGNPSDTATQPWRFTVSHVDRTLGGAAWRAAGVRHVLSRNQAPRDACDAAVNTAKASSANGAKGPVTPVDQSSPNSELIPLAPVFLSARDKLARAWRRYCNAGEGMTNEDYELVIDGEIPEFLRAECRPPK